MEARGSSHSRKRPLFVAGRGISLVYIVGVLDMGELGGIVGACTSK